MIQVPRSKASWILAVVSSIIAGSFTTVEAQWTALVGAPNASTCLLLTDGGVMCQQGEQSSNFVKLTPDQFGRYTTGTWSALASLPAYHCPLYYASAVLADGRVVLIGGEYNCGAPNAVLVNFGSIYNPVANSWTPITPPEVQVGDSDSVVLPDGRFILRHLLSDRLAQFNPGFFNFTQLNAIGKTDNNSEENSVLLPDGRVLSVDSGIQGGTASQIYDPGLNAWVNGGNTVVSLPNNGGMPMIVPELGPGMLRPDGTVVWFGATSHNAIYDTGTSTWSATVDYPIVGGVQQLMFDAPAALLPSGNVLVATSGVFVPPYHTFEFTAANAFVATTTDPFGSAGNPSFKVRMLVLPSGEVLVTDGSNTVQTYATAASVTFQNAWRPVITGAPNAVQAGNTYTVTGRQFNGLSQASMYGDDAQMATNYPLVRITNRATGHVFYARTHNHSSMGVATGNAIVSTQFDAPAGLEAGVSDLEVVANGIPSQKWVVNAARGANELRGFTVAPNWAFGSPQFPLIRGCSDIPFFGCFGHFGLGPLSDVFDIGFIGRFFYTEASFAENQRYVVYGLLETGNESIFDWWNLWIPNARWLGFGPNAGIAWFTRDAGDLFAYGDVIAYVNINNAAHILWASNNSDEATASLPADFLAELAELGVTATVANTVDSNPDGTFDMSIAPPPMLEDCTTEPACQPLEDYNPLPTVLSLDHFQCYEVKRAPFAGPVVNLVDQFASAPGTLVQRPERLCAPADKNDEDPAAPTHPDHLVGYKVRHPFVRALNQSIVNQFGTVTLDVTKPDRLMVPSSKSLTGPPAPLNPVSVDHFQCYKVRLSKGSGRFAPISGVKVDDQFGTATLTLVKPIRLCAPVDKNDEAIGAENDPGHLLCYRSRRVTFSSVDAFVDNQFGPQDLSLITRTEFCVPSLKNPAPTTTTSSTTSTTSTTSTSSTMASPSGAFLDPAAGAV